MSKHRPVHVTRTAAALVAAMAVALVSVATVPSVAAAAKPSQMAVIAYQSANGVTVDGILGDRRARPIAGRQISVRLSTGAGASATTGGDGRFRVVIGVPASTAGGRISVHAQFGGDDQWSPSSASTTASWSGPVNPQPSPPAQPTTTAPTQQAPTSQAPVTPAATVTVTAKADATTVLPGDPVTVTGRLALGSDAIADGSIQLDVPGHDGPPFGAVSGANGTFSVLGQVPASATPGTLTIGVVFLGGEGMPQTRTDVSITVKAAPTPTPTPSVSATPTPVARGGVSEAAVPEVTTSAAPASSTPSPTPSGVQVDPSKFRTLGLWALGLVLVLGLVTSVAHLARSRHPGDDSPTDHLID